MAEKTAQKNILRRTPIVCVMGHVDHGKSTLLEYVRKTNITDAEAGGITQKIGAYEIEFTKENGEKRGITFLDTPGHEAFSAIRARGANVADIAILVVSAEDGVKPQTLDAYRCIKGANTPFVVAVNKIDKPGADVERTKQSLAENEIYLEGYGGDVPWAAVSAKSGEGITELLELIDLVAELNSLSGNPDAPATGYVIEAHLDKRRGPAGSIIVKNGTLKKGEFIVAGSSMAPIRIMEDDLGKSVNEAPMGKPVSITGWNKVPEAGLEFISVKSKKDAESLTEENTNRHAKGNTSNKRPEPIEVAENTITIPVIIKADATGTIDAILHELKKVQTDRAKIKIIAQSVGEISESDAKLAESSPGTVVLGFNTKIDNRAKAIVERSQILVKEFDIIYKLSEWLQEFLTDKTPKIRVEEKSGTAKVLKVFSKDKDRQIIGGKVTGGVLALGAEVIISRRDAEIGRGKVRELQRQRQRVDEVSTGTEFGTMIEAKITITEGDIIEPFKIVEK
jgi:translation initiation factor IF-2